MIAPFLDTIQQYDDLPLDQVIHGDSLEVLKRIQSNAVDSIVCDPPAGINFMNKAFDSNRGGRDAWIAWLSSIMKEAMRCLKPGGHALVWALPRTSHWTATALEDAGFEIRDVLTHLFGSGFPKSLNISLAIDATILRGNSHTRALKQVNDLDRSGAERQRGSTHNNGILGERRDEGRVIRDEPATPEAAAHVGKGTALKPSNEHWILCRKPLSEPTIAANVLKWDGCGAINIDASRIGTERMTEGRMTQRSNGIYNANGRDVEHGNWQQKPNDNPQTHVGRFPSNTLFSHSVWCVSRGVSRVRASGGTGEAVSVTSGTHNWKPGNTGSYGDLDGMEQVEGYECHESCPIAELDRQSGITGSNLRKNKGTFGGMFGNGKSVTSLSMPDDSGGASRFFQRFHPHDDIDAPFYYAAKASRRERNNGLEGMEEKEAGVMDKRPSGDFHTRLGDKPTKPAANTHPTVKPEKLISYLAKLVCPEGGIILDPFAGSGTTGVSAVKNGFHYILVEQDASYCEIARARLAHATKEDTRKASLAEHNGK